MYKKDMLVRREEKRGKSITLSDICGSAKEILTCAEDKELRHFYKTMYVESLSFLSFTLLIDLSLYSLVSHTQSTSLNITHSQGYTTRMLDHQHSNTNTGAKNLIVLKSLILNWVVIFCVIIRSWTIVRSCVRVWSARIYYHLNHSLSIGENKWLKQTLKQTLKTNTHK